MYTLVENYFKKVEEIKSKSLTDEPHRAQIVPKVVISSLIDKLSRDPEIISSKMHLKPHTKAKLSFRLVAIIVLETLKRRKVLLYKDRKIIKKSIKFQNKMHEYEKKSLELAPEVEGRSLCINNEEVII